MLTVRSRTPNIAAQARRGKGVVTAKSVVARLPEAAGLSGFSVTGNPELKCCDNTVLHLRWILIAVNADSSCTMDEPYCRAERLV